MIKAIAYYRFSTERQDSSSIDAQRRNCEKFAAERGLEIVEEFIDEEFSASNPFRPGYQAMDKALRTGEYKVLIANDLSRLHRDVGHQSLLFSFLAFNEIRLLTADGHDSLDKNAKMVAQFKGLLNEYQLSAVRYQTRVAQMGVLARGGVAGGKSYGYINRRDEKTGVVKREINEREALVVRQIFHWFDEGFSPLSIAEKLNKNGISAPKGGEWRRSTIHGDPKDLSGILNNPLYIGQEIWGRGKWEVNPENGKRTRKPVDRKDWIIIESAHLRIIDSDLWNRVKERQNKISFTSVGQKAVKGPKAATGANPKYLLSGFLKCKKCGANLILVNGDKYGCASRKEKGRDFCSFNKLIKRSEIEEYVISSFKAVSKPESLVPIIKTRFAAAVKERAKFEPTVKNAKKELSKVTMQIAKLTKAIKVGANPTLFVEELNTLAARQKCLEGQLQSSGKLATAADLNALAEKAAARVPEMYKEFSEVLANNIYKAREAVGLLCNNRIEVSKDENGDVRIEKTALLGGFFRFSLGVPKFFDTPEIKLVAGAGFEPTTLVMSIFSFSDHKR